MVVVYFSLCIVMLVLLLVMILIGIIASVPNGIHVIIFHFDGSPLAVALFGFFQKLLQVDGDRLSPLLGNMRICTKMILPV